MKIRFLALLLCFAICTTAHAQRFNTTNDPVSADGLRAVVDLPSSQHMKNVGGSDGAGLCVFTSLQHAARWQHIVDLEGYRLWMQSRPGGGYPQKVDSTLAAFCKSKGVPVPQYVQHTGGDDTFLDLCVKTGRSPGVTYAGSDGFYPGGIDHMVNLAHIDSSMAAIIDNNRPGQWVWMSRTDFLTRWRARGGGWAVVFLDPPPPIYNAAPQLVQHVTACPVTCNCKECKCDTCECGVKQFGQCANGRCLPAVQPSTGVQPIGNPPTDRHEWGMIPGVGMGWRFKADPGQELVAVRSDPITGVMPERVHQGKAYHVNGVRVDQQDAEAVLADDSNVLHLAAVGDAAFLTRVKADVATLPVELRAKVLFTAFSSNEWQASQFKLSDGVTLRKPVKGRVGVDMGRVGVAEYNTTTVRDLIQPPPPPAPIVPPPTPVQPVPVKPSRLPWFIVGGAALLLLLKLRK